MVATFPYPGNTYVSKMYCDHDPIILQSARLVFIYWIIGWVTEPPHMHGGVVSV